MKQRRKKSVRMSNWVTAIVTGMIAVGILILALAQSHQPAQAQKIFENVTVRSNFTPDPKRIQGISGGSVPASTVAGRKETPTGPCVGFTDEQPDHTLNLTTFFNYMSLVVDSTQDTTLVISGPGGTWCNDDFQGKNPGMAGQWQPGPYKVWVGSYDKNNYHPYVIKMSQVQLLNPGPFRR